MIYNLQVHKILKYANINSKTYFFVQLNICENNGNKYKINAYSYEIWSLCRSVCRKLYFNNVNLSTVVVIWPEFNRKIQTMVWNRRDQ